MNTLITIIFRVLQIIPLILIIVPIFNSYWEKRNSINGLRRVRLVLLFLFSTILFENLYFIYYGVVAISNGSSVLTPDTFFLILDKLLTFTSYCLMYFLFSHARQHNNDLSEKKQQI